MHFKKIKFLVNMHHKIAIKCMKFDINQLILNFIKIPIITLLKENFEIAWILTFPQYSTL